MRVTSSAIATSAMLQRSARAYAQAALRALEASDEALAAAKLPSTFVHPLEDIEARILQLAAAVHVDAPELFAHTLRWYKVALHHRDVPAEYLVATLDALEAALSVELPESAAAVVRRHLAAGAAALRDAPVDLESHLDRSRPHGTLAMRFLLANLESRGEDALDLVRRAMADGVGVAEIHDHVLVPVQREVGRMWLMAEIPVADEHYGSGVVERTLWLLQDRLPRPGPDAPKVLTMGAGGNLHDFGLRIVAQRLQLAGCAVTNLGANLPATDIAWALTDRRPDLVAMSATMVMHLPALGESIRSVQRTTSADGQRPVPILCGGEPFRIVPDLHRLLGADACATDAESAVAAAQRLLPVFGRGRNR
jgi:MerR family transcriptional regulator, light-induced transcriptional regulator